MSPVPAPGVRSLAARASRRTASPWRSPVLTLLVLLFSVPGALREAFDRGGFYVFSHEFLEDMPKRLTGPGRFRFILQPLIATSSGSGMAGRCAGGSAAVPPGAR